MDNPIPSATAADLASFKGAELTGVSVWKTGVTLSFNNEARTITIENNAEFRSHGRTETYNQDHRRTGRADLVADGPLCGRGASPGRQEFDAYVR
jgi:hypothetical protein